MDRSPGNQEATALLPSANTPGALKKSTNEGGTVLAALHPVINNLNELKPP